MKIEIFQKASTFDVQKRETLMSVHVIFLFMKWLFDEDQSDRTSFQ